MSTGLVVRTNAWHLSILLFKRLCLNQSNKALEASSNDAITFSIFPSTIKLGSHYVLAMF